MSDLLQESSCGAFTSSIQSRICNNIAQESDLLEVVRRSQGDNGSGTAEDQVVVQRNDFRSSTKIEALLERLRGSELSWMTS